MKRREKTKRKNKMLLPHKKVESNSKHHHLSVSNVRMCLFYVLFFFIGEFVIKKLYDTLVKNDENRPRSPFSLFWMKGILFAAIVAFLSNISPNFAANLDFGNTFLEGVESAGVSYPQNIISVAHLNASSVSKDNDVRVLNTAAQEKVKASSDYANFLTRSLSDKENPIVDVSATDDPIAQKYVQNILKIGSIEDKNIQKLKRVELDNNRSFSSSGKIQTRLIDDTRVALGTNAYAGGFGSIAIGAKYENGKWDLGTEARAFPRDSVSIGTNSLVSASTNSAKNGAEGVAVGYFARVVNNRGVALGPYAVTMVSSSIALGERSRAVTSGGIAGYDPVSDKSTSQTSPIWKSSSDYGVLSIGNTEDAAEDNWVTRQIQGVAAGTADTDAVNVAQLKALRKTIKGGWKLSVANKNAKTVDPESIVDFTSGSNNLTITKGGQDNNVKFDLAKDVTLSSAKVGNNTLDAKGLVIPGGPQITTAGIDAGNKEIKNIKAGELSANSQQAVIGSQLFKTNDNVAYTTNRLNALENNIKFNEAEKWMALGFSAQAQGEYAIALGYKANVAKANGIAIGQMAHAVGLSSIAIGSEYHKENGDDYTTAKDDYTTAVGAISKALGYGATALGHRSYAYKNRSISIGFYSRANNDGSIALGSDAKANVDGGVAIGKGSVASVAGNIAGYDPITGKNTIQTNVIWKSSPGSGAVSVGVITGDAKDWKTRQITGLAAGSVDTDAVNVAQLKALRAFAAQGWKLSVGGANATDVSIGGTVDLAAGSTNLKITKGEKDNNIKFDLAKDITLDRAKVGGNTLDATGLVITSGPKITTAGIDAGNKEIKNIKAGELSANSQQAVTGSQLYATNNNVTQNTNKITEANTKITKNIADITTANSNISSLDKNISTYFGGGANVLQGKGPTYKIQDQQYNDVGSAFEGVNSSFTNVNNKITEVEKNLLVKQEEETKLLSSDEVSKKGMGVITIGKETSGIEISVLNQEKFTRTISGLRGGKLTENSNEAVNGGQMYVLGNKIATYLGGGC
ncbi:hypothetical protein MCW_01655 [Cardidatus Bartonella washoeensis 085-0475]|uniref:Trimeric autotransporter adhesin YadA-like head domain-containing protein n=1 Tax=Cardidatus Bartonella washoeensis 085-0475 TaxID=1094564 RepID=J1JEN7_9HYPH|nr:hypothetical protein MCW_01655 [Bartonella washoeensis 085-0475]